MNFAFALPALPPPSRRSQTAQRRWLQVAPRCVGSAPGPEANENAPTRESGTAPAASSPDKASSRSIRAPYTLRARLREETEAPFRKVRQFVFVGSAMSAAVGAFISALRIAASLSGVRGVQPLVETSQNLGINLTAIGICAVLWKRDQDAGARRLERMSRGARIAKLRIEDSITRQPIRIGDLRSEFRVVIVAGPAAKIAATLQEAESVRKDLTKRQVKIVPLVVDSTRSRGSADGGDESVQLPLGTWIARPLDASVWLDWLESEKEMSSKSKLPIDEVLVIIIKLNGKVGSRSIGAPRWPSLVSEV
jgi:Low psii accumulation1 / Rep27